MTRSMIAKLERSSLRRIPYELGCDEKGPLIGYCPYPTHRQIVGNGILVKCMQQQCSYLEIFRREKSIPDEGILLQILITPDREDFKTENKRQKAESRLIYAAEIIRDVTKRYVQSEIKEDNKDVYNVTAEILYRKKARRLESCPLSNYPKPKKEKIGKIPRKTKKKLAKDR